MPPYDVRGEENGAKRHRAVLIGVEHYRGARNDLPSVTTNLRLMREALTDERTGVLAPEDLVVVPPDGGGPDTTVDPNSVRTALAAARKEVTGLLVVYFAGHGIVRTDGSDLNLMFTDSEVTRDRHHPFVTTLSWDNEVMGVLRNSHADWVVVILDCCFAGNALRAFQPAVGQNFALLTAAEPGVEVPPGDARTGTEFTAALHRLLTTGKGEPVTFTRIVEGIREAMEPFEAVDGHPWIPDELRHGDDVVLAFATDAERPVASDPDPPDPKPPHEDKEPQPPEQPSRRRFPGVLSRLTRTAAVVLAGVVALAGAGAWYFLGGSSGGPCPSPLELRVLADPDFRATVQKAADAYPKRDGDGCRTVGINVYDAKATDAVAALRSSSLWQEPPASCPPSGDCPRPQRDVGAQPDIWIPAAGSAWQRATAGAGGGTASTATATGDDGDGPAADAGRSVVGLDRLGSIAYTPMVLGVPDTMRLAQSLQTDDPLGAIVSGLKEDQTVEILRPDPEDTEGALLATDALYASSGSVGTLEQRMSQVLRPMPSTARELMCVLADGAHNDLEDRAAVLVPEQTLAQFNLSAGEPGRPSCATEALAHRVAHYPSDVQMLDLPFIRVTWAGADRDAAAREDAVKDFYTWLATDADAQKCFTDDGFRGVADGAPAPPSGDSVLAKEDNTSAVREQIPQTGPGADVSTSLTDTLDRYRGALGPGRVLYLLDNSTSMADKRVWDGTGGAKELVARSMSSLGAGDSYGVWLAAVAEGKRATDRVPFGSAPRADAQKAVAGAGTAAFDARIASGVREALGTLRESPGEEQPRLLVLVTDGEDFEAVKEKEQRRLVTEAGRTPLVRVVTVSLQDGACAPGRFGERLAEASGGRCLDPADDIAAELAAEVAKTGTGDAE